MKRNASKISLLDNKESRRGSNEETEWFNGLKETFVRNTS